MKLLKSKTYDQVLEEAKSKNLVCPFMIEYVINHPDIIEYRLVHEAVSEYYEYTLIIHVKQSENHSRWALIEFPTIIGVPKFGYIVKSDVKTQYILSNKELEEQINIIKNLRES